MPGSDHKPNGSPEAAGVVLDLYQLPEPWPGIVSLTTCYQAASNRWHEIHSALWNATFALNRPLSQQEAETVASWHAEHHRRYSNYFSIGVSLALACSVPLSNKHLSLQKPVGAPLLSRCTTAVVRGVIPIFLLGYISGYVGRNVSMNIANRQDTTELDRLNLGNLIGKTMFVEADQKPFFSIPTFSTFGSRSKLRYLAYDEIVASVAAARRESREEEEGKASHTDGPMNQ